MTYHENPANIPVGTAVALTYENGNTYAGTVTGLGLMTDTSGRTHSITGINRDLVMVLGDAKVDRTDLDRLADATAEVERLQAVVKQRDADVSSAITAVDEAREREQDVTETLDDLKRETSDLLVQIGHDYGIDDVDIDDMHDRLGIDRPKAEPIDVEVTVKVTARLTPASRTTARNVGLGSFLEDSVIGLDLIDFDADSFEVDVYRGLNVEVTDYQIN